MLQLYTGYNLSSNHEADNEIKALNKSINERNKSIKDFNRKLKKDNSNNKLLYELTELELLTGRVVKTNDGSNLMYNYFLRFIDLSRNSDITDDELLRFQSSLLNILSSGQCHIPNTTGHDALEGNGNNLKVLTLCLRGLGTDDARNVIQNGNYNGMINIVF